MNKKYIQANLPSTIFILDEINKNYKKFLVEQNDGLKKYYKTNTNQVGFVSFSESIPLNSKEITKDEYESQKGLPTSPTILTKNNYYWEKESLKGTKERMPPVEYQGEVISSKGSETPIQYGMYMGKLGDYNQQLEEHNSFMKKWFKDNAPGEDFYKNNMFYIMGSDGLPKFNQESLKNHVVGLHPEEANVYFAKKNNLLTEYNKKLNEIKKTHDATTQRLKTEKENFEAVYGIPIETNYYRPGTGTQQNDYDPQGGLGQTLLSPSSGGVATGSRKTDNRSNVVAKNAYFNGLIKISDKFNTELNTYINKINIEKSQYEKKLKNLNNEYIHPEFEWGIKKEEYEIYKKLDAAQKAKWADINKKKIEWSQKLWKEHNAAEQIGQTGFDVAFSDGPTYNLSKETIDLGKLLYSLADQPLVNWVNDDVLKQQIALQQLKVKTEDLMIEQIYNEELEMLQMSFGKKTDKQREEERLANRPWYEKVVDITEYDVHDWMMLISIVCMIIPGLQGVGFATRFLGIGEITALGIGLTDAAILAAAVDLLDAGIYVSEGNWELAGLSVLFALVPFAIESNFVKRIGKEGLKKMANFAKSLPDAILKGTGNMTMEEIYRYTKMILDDDIKLAIKAMSENSAELIEKIKLAYKNGSEKILGKAGAKTLNEGIQKSLKFSYNGMKYLAPKIGGLAKIGVTFGGYMAMGAAFHKSVEYTNENIIKTPKSYAESLNLDWNTVKSEFHSDGSIKDNELLKEALLMGWRPGIPVPIQYQTSSYKKWLSSKSESVKKEITDEEIVTEIEKILLSPSVKEKLKKEKLKEETKKIEKFIDNNDDEIDKIGDEILEKYANKEKTSSEIEIDEKN
jgi:hypothetical protein